VSREVGRGRGGEDAARATTDGATGRWRDRRTGLLLGLAEGAGSGVLVLVRVRVLVLVLVERRGGRRRERGSERAGEPQSLRQ
jgi:hypothetical protein